VDDYIYAPFSLHLPCLIRNLIGSLGCIIVQRLDFSSGNDSDSDLLKSEPAGEPPSSSPLRYSICRDTDKEPRYIGIDQVTHGTSATKLQNCRLPKDAMVIANSLPAERAFIRVCISFIAYSSSQ